MTKKAALETWCILKGKKAVAVLKKHVKSGYAAVKICALMALHFFARQEEYIDQIEKIVLSKRCSVRNRYYVYFSLKHSCDLRKNKKAKDLFKKIERLFNPKANLKKAIHSSITSGIL